MIVVSLSNDLGLGAEISKALGIKHLTTYTKVFPDGEVYVRLQEPKSLRNVIAYVVQSLYPNQNDKIMELLLGIDALYGAGAKEVKAIIPYMAYSRQDRIFLEGEAVSIRALFNALYSLGVNEIITIDIHSVKAMSYFKGKIHNILPTKLFAERLRTLGINGSNTIVVAPDEGAKERASKLSNELNLKYVVIKKFRDRITGEIKHELPKELEVSGMNVVVIDDIISTGGTIANISKYLRSRNVKNIIVAATHGLFVGNALEKLRSSGISKILLISTVPKINDPLLEYLSPVNLIAKAIVKE